MSVSIVLLGPPAVGKGTQSVWLGEHLGVPVISTGQIFRSNIVEGTRLGKQAQEYMEKGALVPDSVTTPMVAERLAAPDVMEKGFVLDGFPRTLAQGHALKDILESGNTELDMVLELAAHGEILISRMLNRAKEQDRSDDNEETFRNRLREYYESTQPLSQFYSDQHLLEVVDGTGSREEVEKLMILALKSRGLCSANQ